MAERVPVRATRNNGLDFIEVPTQDEAWIAALQRERRGYVERGNTGQVALVDEQIELLRKRVAPSARPTPVVEQVETPSAMMHFGPEPDPEPETTNDAKTLRRQRRARAATPPS